MKFINNKLNIDKMQDGVFKIANMAKADNNKDKINATIGSLYNEDNELVCLESFYQAYKQLDDKVFCKYADTIKGNNDYIETIIKHVLEDKVSLAKSCIATSGGTGAIYMTIKNTLEESDTLLIPNIAWGSYKLMASEFGLNVLEYDIYNIEDMLAKMQLLADKQSKVLVIINSPCHNPCGISYTEDDFNKVINTANNLKTPCIILNDIAYIDYSFDLVNSRNYMRTFNDINENVMIVVAYSLSKSMTAYGLRCGAAIILTKNQDDNDAIFNVFEKTARSTWSNINNSVMVNFANLLKDHSNEYNDEKDKYINLLKKRATLFLDEADDAKLEYYPFNEGFFITLKYSDNHKRDIDHQKLLDNHIYTVKVNLGIRIAICSISLANIKGLAYRIKEIIEA